MIHAIAKVAESADSPRNRIRIEHAARKSVVSQAHRGSFAFQYLDVLRRGSAPDRQADGVRSGVDRG
jgi:ABC-type hemin transport system ATPase subunit